jgi:hypothetical protein
VADERYGEPVTAFPGAEYVNALERREAAANFRLGRDEYRVLKKGKALR